MPKLAIDLSGTAGLAPKFYGDRPFATSNPNYRHIGSDGQMADGVYDPMTLLGYISPANDTVKDITGTTNFLLTSAVVVPSNITNGTTNAIFFADEAVAGTQGQIMTLDTAIDTSLAQAYQIPLIGGTDYSKSTDFALYQVNGIKQIFFTRINTTTTGSNDAIGIASYSFGSPSPQWSISGGATGHSSSLLSTRGRAVFVLADNAILYVLTGSTVFSIDGTITGGTNGTIASEVLVFLGSPSSAGTLAPLTTIIDGIDLRGKMWMGLQVNGNINPEVFSAQNYNFSQFVGVYVWDRRTTVASMQDFIVIPGAREMKSMHILQGQPMCFTVSSEGYTQLRMWDGNQFKVSSTLGKSAYPNYRRHSVVEMGDMIYWLGADGIIYAYGKFEPELNNALYKIGDMNGHVTGGQTYLKSGILIALNGIESASSGRNTLPLAFYASFTDTGGNHLEKFYPHAWDPATTTQIANTTPMYSLVELLPKLSNIHGVTIFFPSVGSGGSTSLMDVNIYLNHSATSSATYTLTQDDATRGWAWMPLEKINVNAVQLGLTYKAQAIANNITPYIATVDYDVTVKTK